MPSNNKPPGGCWGVLLWGVLWVPVVAMVRSLSGGLSGFNVVHRVKHIKHSVIAFNPVNI